MLLTVNNQRTSPISFQTDGLAFVSFTVPGSGAVTNKALTPTQFAALEPQLIQQTTAGNITWSSKDDPSTDADGAISGPGTVVFENDFMLAAGATAPVPFVKDVHNSATGDYLNDVLAGIYSLATAAVSEAEGAQITWGNQLMIDPTKKPVFEARVRLNIPGATPSADERWVVGLVSDHTNAEDALDATTLNAWFRGEGANLNIYIEGDDNTTNTDDVDSGIDYVDNAWMVLKIDMSDLTKVKFYVNGKPAASTISLAALTASNLLQPIFCYQRDAGTEINLLEVDWMRVVCSRT